MSRLQPAFSVRNAREEKIYDVSQGNFETEDARYEVTAENEEYEVNAPNQPYFVNPRNVPNTDAYGVATDTDRDYWKGKTRVNTVVQPAINPLAHGVPAVQDRNYWKSRQRVNANDQPFDGKGGQGLDADPRRVPNFRARFKNQQGNLVQADAQPFNSSQVTPQQRIRDLRRGPTNQDTQYWRSKQVVSGQNEESQFEGTQHIMVNGVMTPVTFVDDEQYEVQGIQGYDSSINARNQELSKLNYLRNQQNEVDARRQQALNNINVNGRVNVQAPYRRVFVQNTDQGVVTDGTTTTTTGTTTTGTTTTGTTTTGTTTTGTTTTGTTTGTTTCAPGSFPDCFGKCNGKGIKDCKGVCFDPTKGPPPNAVDCTGTCGGKAQFDCMGVCNGTSELDCAGTCYDPSKQKPPHALDCKGICGGPNVPDCKGVCGGGNVLDCKGVCGGTATQDCTGQCGGTASYDCFGVCKGPGRFDCSGKCFDSSKGGPTNIRDCNGNCSAANQPPAYFNDCSGNCIAGDCFKVNSGFKVQASNGQIRKKTFMAKNN